MSPAIDRCHTDETGSIFYCEKLAKALSNMASPIGLGDEDRVYLFRVHEYEAVISFCPWCGGSLRVPSVPVVPSVTGRRK